MSILLVIVCICMIIESQASWNGQLKFKNDSTFRVFQLTDLHYRASSKLEDYDEQNMKIEDKLLRMSKPDFVAFTGDMVGGGVDGDFNTFYQRKWYKYTFANTQHEIPYALTLGNHDATYNMNRREIVEFDIEHGLFSMTQESPAGVSGASNFYIPVHSNLNPGQVSLVMWFLDTKDSECMGQTHTYGCIEPDQIQWFEEEFDILQEAYGSFMSVVFIHIPLPEYVQLLTTESIYGNFGEQCCCPSVNTGFFKTLVDRKIRAVFCGHDHRNDFGGYLNGVELIYGRKTGFGSYGPSSFSYPLMMRGGTELNFKEYKDKSGNLQVELTHRVLLEDGLYRSDQLSYKRYFLGKQSCKPP